MRNLVVGCICMLFISSLGTAQADYKEIKYSGETEGKKSLKMAKENQLMHAYDVKFYKLDLEVDDESVFISGEVSILLEVTDNSISTLVFQLLNQLDIESVFIDDQELNFTHQDNEITISLDSPASAGSLLTARVKYSGYAGGGLFTGVDSRYLPFPITATLSEPFYAKDWFPCKEVLGDKADSVHVFITTEYGLKGVSNGMNTGTTYLPNGKIRHEWKSNYPIAYYLISIAVSDYMEYNIVANPKGSTEPLLIQNFLYNDEYYLNRYKAEIDETIDIMELFAELFGPYPFQDEKYGHYLWPWGGGMEHQTMTGMGNFNFGLNAHELGHSWFGNYVTCATWQDIWINEGFASYAAYLATENLRPGQASTELISSFESAMREPNGSVFVPESGANSDSRIFSGSLSYRKGMALVHMIRYELQDDELFFSILKNFTQQYAFSVARGVDFQAVLEAESGMDFTDFFDQWYFGFGFPSFSLMWEQSGSTVTLYSKQTTSSTMTPLFKTPLEFKLYYDGGDTIVSGYHNTNDEIFVFNIDETIENIAIDPDNWLLNGFDGVQELVGIEKNQSLFRLYPNPNEGVFSFTVPEEAGNELKLEVFNSINQLVYSESIKDFAPNSEYTVDLDSPRSGIYFIRFSSKTYVETKRILIK